MFKDGNFFCVVGCKLVIIEKDSYGIAGDLGFSFVRYVYKGKLYGLLYNNVVDVVVCMYLLMYVAAEAVGLEYCFYVSYTGGVSTTTV